MRKTLAIISPVYNEVEVIESFYREVKARLAQLVDRYDSTILLVLDRCTDDTLSVVRHLAANDPSLRCVVLSSRFGHQMSLLAGLDHARADVYIMMDSDLQHPPSLIPDMLAAYETGADVVYTVRTDSTPSPDGAGSRARRFTTCCAGYPTHPFYENAADFRLVTEKVARVFRTEIRERKMFMRGLISWVGFQQQRLDTPPGGGVPAPASTR